MPRARFAALSWFEGGAENAGVVEEGAADAECIAEMHRGHGGKGVDVFAGHPNGLGFIVADGVKEAILGREETGWHAWVADEDYKGEKVGKGHGAADSGEGCVGWSNVVEPSDEAMG